MSYLPPPPPTPTLGVRQKFFSHVINDILTLRQILFPLKVYSSFIWIQQQNDRRFLKNYRQYDHPLPWRQSPCLRCHEINDLRRQLFGLSKCAVISIQCHGSNRLFKRISFFTQHIIYTILAFRLNANANSYYVV